MPFVANNDVWGKIWVRRNYYNRVAGGVRVATNATAARILGVDCGAEGAGDKVPHPCSTIGLVATQYCYHRSSGIILLPLSGNSEAKVRLPVEKYWICCTFTLFIEFKVLFVNKNNQQESLISYYHVAF